MSKYTTEIRFLCETLAGNTESQGGSKVNQILQVAAPQIFDFDFPIFDPDYKLPLEIKILRHFYTREISEETVALWKLRLEDRMNVIMPYYNQLYHSALLEFNPLYDIELTTSHEGSGSGTETNDNETNGNKGINENENIDETGVNIDDKMRNENKSGNSEEDKTYTKTNVAQDYDDKERAENKTNNKTSDFNGETTGTEATDNISQGNNLTNGTKWNLFSDTPQEGIDGIEGVQNGVDTHYYLTDATKDTNQENSSNTNSGEADTVRTANEFNESHETGNENGRITENLSKNGTSIEANDGSNNRNFDENTENTESNVNTHDISKNRDNEINENYSSNSISNKVSTTTNEYLEKISGKTGGRSYSAMLAEYRETFINIDEMILEELNDLFFGLW